MATQFNMFSLNFNSLVSYRAQIMLSLPPPVSEEIEKDKRELICAIFNSHGSCMVKSLADKQTFRM